MRYKYDKDAKMAKNKKLPNDADPDIDIKDVDADNIANRLLDDVELDSQNSSFVKSDNKDEGGDDMSQFQPEEMVDFSNFNIDDFDAALNSYQAARAGQALTIEVPAKPKQKSTPPVAKQPVVDNVFHEPDPVPTPKKVAPKVETRRTQERPRVNPSTINEGDFLGNNRERQQDIMYWYNGNLSDKTYRISADHMPEFLDSDKTIRVVHVEVDSVYGWNVFFDNGVFMSLKDLKEYQERHGQMPCQDGKLVYGNKTSSFERILKVVVYERPRYFSYRAK